MRLDRSSCLELVRAARVARLATSRADGLVDVVPCVFALSAGGETLVSAVDHKPKTTTALQRLANIAARPDVTLLVDHYSEDWSQLWWVRVRGVAEVVDPATTRNRDAIDLLAAKYPQYAGDGRPTGSAIVVRIAEMTGWSAATHT